MRIQSLNDLVIQARQGDLEAYSKLIKVTQPMAYSLSWCVLHDAALAHDATQEAYLRAFRRLADLVEPGAFLSWLRRIVITAATNMKRTQRTTLLRLDDVPDIPVLDATEESWSEAQRQQLAAAILTLTSEERRLCDRRYHGHWSILRLAEAEGVDEAVMRKRLQRVRDKLRKEIEMSEKNGLPPEGIMTELPRKIVELLARPKLTDLPENPVGKTQELLRSIYSDFAELEVPEMFNVSDAQKMIGTDIFYLQPHEMHHVDSHRILRYDLTIPILLAMRYENHPIRIWAAGKVYRRCQSDPMHLEAFHQAEVLWIDKTEHVDAWRLAGEVLQSVELLIPGSTVRIVPTKYPMCTQAWDLEVELDGNWNEVLAWGTYTPSIVRSLGANPDLVSAVGVGYGLERLAMLRYRIDDVRKIELAKIG
jgi:RNA polymerase sigma factor (sigma-70 family)